MESKKRKYDCIMNENLTISKVHFLPCDICHSRVYNYRFCTSPFVYCSYDCYALLVLSNKNGYLDMKRVKSEDDLTTDDENIFCMSCSTIHSKKDRAWCEFVDKYEQESSFASI